MTPPFATLGRRYRFSASHRLHIDTLSAEANRGLYGKCNNPHGHGHNYIVEIAYRGPVDTQTGMVVDLAALDAFASRELVEPFDLTNLNTLAAFATDVPSTENLAIAVHGIFLRFHDVQYPHARLAYVHVDETSNNSFEYFGGNVPSAAVR